jgi:hypothetical protein
LRCRATSAAFLLAALGACGPSVDPAAKVGIDRQVALLGQSPQQVPAPTDFQPRPFAVGQWTKHKVCCTRGRPTFLTTKIVGMEGNAYWFESVLESDFGKVTTKLLVFVGDRRDPHSIEVLAGRIRSLSGSLVEIPPWQLPMERSMFHMVLSWEGQPQEDALVPAGSFRYCFKGKNVWGPRAAASLAWSHPAVPISGLVRAEGLVRDERTSVELIGYGDSRATAEVP